MSRVWLWLWDTVVRRVTCKYQATVWVAATAPPPPFTTQGLEGLHQSLSNIWYRRSHPNISIDADFIYPDISTGITSALQNKSSNPSTCYQKLSDILLYNSVSQTVREVNRRPSSNNMLDLVVTSNPALVESVCVQSGISDHKIVTFTLAANPNISAKSLKKTHTRFTKMTNSNWEMQPLNLLHNFSNQIQREDQ